eukprot:TRINITY_DN67268_c7_g1_i1.p1 TRINITY_DN67268_c7_g1~~TRINITY_DN67268_c7_g1_i1.p1  ORF type:complete len:361 (+),score=188.28 TRINITY_DN67268_c7_g1_i1:156-1085(+)
MSVVVETLAAEYKHVTFVRIAAESVPALAKRYQVSSVPTSVLVKAGKVVEAVEGAAPPALIEAVKRHATAAASQQLTSQQQPNQQAQQRKPKELSEEELNARLARLVNAAPVMLFMKGTPDAPRCKFSRRMIELLKEAQVAPFGYFDIFTDHQVRQGLKKFSNWPTYPQLYVNGKLVGGLDVVKELHEDGELVKLVPKSSSGDALQSRLKQLVNKERFMLFMKGTPDAPQCGFSARMVNLLRSAGFAQFGHFNILEDNEVRQGLKKFSNWPTYPQFYVNGKLIGGLDVVQDLHEDGELAPLATKDAVLK